MRVGRVVGRSQESANGVGCFGVTLHLVHVECDTGHDVGWHECRRADDFENGAVAGHLEAVEGSVVIGLIELDDWHGDDGVKQTTHLSRGDRSRAAHFDHRTGFDGEARVLGVAETGVGEGVASLGANELDRLVGVALVTIDEGLHGRIEVGGDALESRNSWALDACGQRLDGSGVGCGRHAQSHGGESHDGENVLLRSC